MFESPSQTGRLRGLNKPTYRKSPIALTKKTAPRERRTDGALLPGDSIQPIAPTTNRFRDDECPATSGCQRDGWNTAPTTLGTAAICRTDRPVPIDGVNQGEQSRAKQRPDHLLSVIAFMREQSIGLPVRVRRLPLRGAAQKSCGRLLAAVSRGSGAIETCGSATEQRPRILVLGSFAARRPARRRRLTRHQYRFAGEVPPRLT